MTFLLPSFYLSHISGFLQIWKKSVKLVSKGKISDNKFDSGLCVLIYAANLAQSPGTVLTDSGIDNLIHKRFKPTLTSHLQQK